MLIDNIHLVYVHGLDDLRLLLFLVALAIAKVLFDEVENDQDNDAKNQEQNCNKDVVLVVALICFLDRE